MAPRKSALNKVWEYFEIQDKSGKAICNICKLSMKSDRTFNLKTHLQKLHKINFKKDDESPTSTPTSSITARKQNIRVNINKKTLLRSYIGLVTEDCLPFNVLNFENLRNIVDPICEGLNEKLGKRMTLNAQNCKKSLKDVAENIRNSMKDEMKNRLLSLKIDSASRLSRNIFGISAQFVKDDAVKSFILGMVELKGVGSSASKNLSAEIVRTLKKYSVDLKQIVSITSDNGANMIKATKLLSQMVSDDVETDEELNDTYLSNIQMMDKAINMRVEQIEICRCAAHTAQLCALDVTKENEIKEFLLCCRNFTKYVRKPSNGFKDMFELKNIKLPQLDNTTRWGSTYKMLESLLAAKDVLMEVESIRGKNSEENFENNEGLWDFIESYVTVFAPLQESIIKFQAENLNYSDFYAQWLKCKMVTTKIISKNCGRMFVKTIGEKLLESFERRSLKLMDNAGLNACLFLDPRFHHTLSPTKRQEAVKYLKHIWEKMKSVSPAPEESLCEDTTLYSNHINNEAEDMLNTYLKEQLRENSGETAFTDVFSKIANLHLPFMRSDTNVLQFWKNRKQTEPELYALSNVCFGIPPTQVTHY